MDRSPLMSAERVKLTKAQRRVLANLSRRDGKATNYELAYPRQPMMHRIFMAGWVIVEGPVHAYPVFTHDHKI